MVSSQGGIYERKVTQIVDEIGIFGGLLDICMLFGFLIYMLTYKPFRELWLATQFSALKNQICHEEGLMAEDTGTILDHKFVSGTDSFKFYAIWYCHKMFPKWLSNLLCHKSRSSVYDEETTIQDMTDYMDE